MTSVVHLPVTRGILPRNRLFGTVVMVSKMWYGKMSGRLIPMPCVGYSPPGGVHSVQCTALLRSPLAAMLGPTQALPFADEQELGEAWHAVPGFTRAVPTAQQMQSFHDHVHPFPYLTPKCYNPLSKKTLFARLIGIKKYLYFS